MSWAHPMFGNYLASCSYDKKVIVWKEMNNSKWAPFYEYCGHESSGNLTNSCSSEFFHENWKCFTISPVNTVQWAPSEFGLIFACGSSDGSISVVSLNGDGNWSIRKIDNAHPVSVGFPWFYYKCNSLNLIVNRKRPDAHRLVGRPLFRSKRK